ncbi:MFS transporter [Thermodesulfobacteriota bacterium]
MMYNKNKPWIILFSATLAVMGGAMISPVLNLMRDGLSVDPASVGLIVTTHGLFIAIFSPLMGSLIDKIGPKKPYAFGLILYGLGGGSGLIIESFWVLLISRAILGIGVAAFFNAITVLILNMYDGEERNKVMGWRGSANSLGGIVYPLIGGFLGSFSWHHPFALYLIGIPLGIIALIAVPEIYIEKAPKEVKETTVLKVFRRRPILLAIYGFMFMSHVFLYVLIIFLPQHLEKIDISNPFHISLFITAMTISAALTSFRYHRIRSKLSYKMIFLLTLALWAIGFAAISKFSVIILMLLSLALLGIGFGMVFPTIPLLIGEIVPISFRGRFSSYIGTAFFIGQFLSPIIFAPVLVLLGLKGVFLVAAGFCALVFVAINIIDRIK